MLKQISQRIREAQAGHAAPQAVVVCLGDSVTRGCFAAGEFDKEAVYPSRLLRKLDKQWPACNFSIVNAGIGGDSAAGGLRRLERDVLSRNPDLVTIAFGLNDSGGGEAGVAPFAESLRTLVREIRAASKADIILLTPSFMNSGDAGDIVADEHRKAGLVEAFAERQKGGLLGRYAEAVRGVGLQMGCLVADVYGAWGELAAGGVDTTALLSNGLNHPNRESHEIPARLLFELIRANLCEKE